MQLYSYRSKGERFFSWHHLCGGTSTPPVSIVTTTKDQIWSYIKAEHVWLFTSKATAGARSLNQIAPREISDIIWSTFLTSLGCGRWSSEITSLSLGWSCFRAKENHPMRRTTHVFSKKGDIMEVDPDWATYPDVWGENRAVFHQHREYTNFHQKLHLTQTLSFQDVKV